MCSGALASGRAAPRPGLGLGHRRRHSRADEIGDVLHDLVDVVRIAQALAELFDPVGAGDGIEIGANQQDQPPVHRLEGQMGQRFVDRLRISAGRVVVDLPA